MLTAGREGDTRARRQAMTLGMRGGLTVRTRSGRPQRVVITCAPKVSSMRTRRAPIPPRGTKCRSRRTGTPSMTSSERQGVASAAVVQEG